MNKVYIGFDSREADAYAVCKNSILRLRGVAHPPSFTIHPLLLPDLKDAGLYTRPTEMRDGRLFDVISDHPMATEFAISRFLVPHLVRSRTTYNHYTDKAIFMDSDMLLTQPIENVFKMLDSRYAVQLVKHDYADPSAIKMDGQVQAKYPRKNWSSFILWNVGHKALDVLTPDFVNRQTGRSLHGFEWLDDSLIGDLPNEWNHLVGIDKHYGIELARGGTLPPANLHFTQGVPSMKGYEKQEYAERWFAMLHDWARS